MDSKTHANILIQNFSIYNSNLTAQLFEYSKDTYEIECDKYYVNITNKILKQAYKHFNFTNNSRDSFQEIIVEKRYFIPLAISKVIQMLNNDDFRITIFNMPERDSENEIDIIKKSDKYFINKSYCTNHEISKTNLIELLETINKSINQ